MDENWYQSASIQLPEAFGDTIKVMNLYFDRVAKDRPKAISVRLPLFERIFFQGHGRFVRHSSLTDTATRFLVDCAAAREHIDALANAVKLEARALGQSPRDVVKKMLQDEGYGSSHDLEALCDAVLTTWGLDSNADS